MTVNISYFAGAGAQFFDSNGAPLSGGLIYTYAGGTTTPAVTYTSSTGVTPNTNPIVLDAAGRTPNEIWITSGNSYKFVLQTSTSVNIGTYDDIPAVNDFTTINAQIAVIEAEVTALQTDVSVLQSEVLSDKVNNALKNSRFDLAKTGAVNVDVDNTPTSNNVDSWYLFQNAVSDCTSAQFPCTDIDGVSYYLRIGRNAGSTETGAIGGQQALSTLDSVKYAGKVVTLSLILKYGVGYSGSDVNIALISSTGTDQSPTTMGSWAGFTTPIGQGQLITGSPVRYVFTGTLPADCTQIGVRFYYTPSGTASVDDNLYVTQVDLRVGTATLAEIDAKPDRTPFLQDMFVNRPVALTAGRLSNLGASDPFSQCHLVPHAGNLILIGDVYEVIPDGYIASSGGVIANYNSCSIDRVLNQTLTPNTFYFVYVYMLNRVMTLDFSQTPYRPDTANETKIGDPLMTHVGILYTTASSKTRGGARAQTIASYNNAFRVTLETQVTGPTTATTVTQLPDVGILPSGEPQCNFLEWVQYGDTAPRVTAWTTAGNSVSGNTCNLGIGLNSKTVVNGFYQSTRTGSTANRDGFIGCRASPTDATGYYYAQALGWSDSAGTMQIDGVMHADGVEA